MKLLKHSMAGAFAAVLLATTPRLAQACAMCGLAPGDHEVHAFNTSVLFMMMGPYTIFGAMVAGLYLVYRSARRRRHSSPPGPAPAGPER